MTSNPYIEQLTQSLVELNSYMVLLFSSYANDQTHENSNLDILIVTNDEFSPLEFNALNEPN